MSACLNCGATLQGDFCHQCGQKLPRANPSLGEVLRDASEEIGHWDGKIPSTLIALLFKPGRLTLDFFEGRRARWLPPLRLYLICSVVYFVTGPAIRAITDRPERQAVRLGITVSDSAAVQLTPEERAELDSSTFARILGKERVDRLLNEPGVFQESFDRNYPKAMFVLLPLFALLTRLVYRKSGRNYPAHLYYALHLHAAAFGALAVTKLLTAVPSTAWELVLGFAVLGYIIWYAMRSARVVFGGSVIGTLGRLAVVGAFYWVFFIFSTFALIALTVASW